MSDKALRIAIVNGDKCKPKKCRQECRRNCPVVRLGKECVTVTKADKVSVISEEVSMPGGLSNPIVAA